MIKTIDDAAYIISGHGYYVQCNPKYGGRIDRLNYLNTPILRATLDEDDPDPLQSACFPLVPFSNRIRNGEFIFENRHHKLKDNWNGDQPVIHGQGWIKSWTYEKITEHKMIMSLSANDWWPWPFQAQQIISISDAGVAMEISVTNISPNNMPAGLGFHPYFQRRSDTQMQCNAEKIWEPMNSGPLSLATDQSIGFNNEGRNVNDITLDHCFDTIRDDIIIKSRSQGLIIKMERLLNARHAVIFVPDKNGNYLCVEPVSHITGAVGDNVGDIDILAPGQTMRLSMRINAEQYN